MTPLYVGIALAILSEGFFAGSEMAMVASNRVRLSALANAGNAGAAHALALLQREDRLIATCLVGTNLSVISGTTLTALVVSRFGLAPTWGLLYVPLTVALGEALPKTVFHHHATALAPTLARPLAFAQFAFAPLLWVAQLWSTRLRRFLGEPGDRITRADIVQMFEDGAPQIDPHEHRLIENLFWLREVTVEDCMTPLVEVHMLPTAASCAEAVDLAVRCGHSRIPVYYDRVDNVVGVLTITDLLWDVPDARDVRAVMQRARFVPESKRADDLLHEMRRNRERIVVVVDEYGGSVGIVTIEDLLEEFIGEIHDERDAHEPGIRRLGERAWRVPARSEIEPLSLAIGRPLPEGDYDTVAGLLLTHLGRIPQAGEVCEIDGLVFRIEESTDRAIVSVHLSVRPPAG